jgi:periplasmic protein TonB
MTYVQPNTNSRRASTLLAVGAIHAVVIYGIVTAFGIVLIPRPVNPPFAGWQVPTKNIPDPPPSPKPSDRIVIVRDSQRPIPSTPPLPPIGGTPPLPPIGYGEATGTVGTGGSSEGLGDGGIGTVEFPTPSATPPLFTPTAPRPRGDQTRWVTQENYPTRAINLGHEGITRVRLSVATSGRVAGCEVITSSGSPMLDSATCEGLTRRARFDPATDTAGVVTSAPYVTSVRWELPD